MMTINTAHPFPCSHTRYLDLDVTTLWSHGQIPATYHPFGLFRNINAGILGNFLLRLDICRCVSALGSDSLGFFWGSRCYSNPSTHIYTHTFQLPHIHSIFSFIFPSCLSTNNKSIASLHLHLLISPHLPIHPPTRITFLVVGPLGIPVIGYLSNLLPKPTTWSPLLFSPNFTLSEHSRLPTFISCHRPLAPALTPSPARICLWSSAFRPGIIRL